jgi:hypothetical protein
MELEETIKKLVGEILKDPDKYPEEAKLLLKLSVWHRQGPSYTDEADYEILKGEVKEITLREWDEGYPHRRGKDIVLVPLEMPTVILYKQKDETSTKRKVYVLQVRAGK